MARKILAINYFMPKMSKFPKGICATKEKTSRKEGKKTGLKMRQPKGGMKRQPEFSLSEVYLENHLALLPEPKLEKVKYF